MVAIGTTRQSLADAYKALGNWFAACTGNPGTSGTVANEATGGGYARLQGTWTSGSNGALTCTNVVLSVAAATYTFGALCSAVSGANQLDNAAITSTTFATAGQLVLTPAFSMA